MWGPWYEVGFGVLSGWKRGETQGRSKWKRERQLEWGWGIKGFKAGVRDRNNVFRRRLFYRSHPPPSFHPFSTPTPFVVSNALCELHCKISLYSCAMHPLYPMPETFFPCSVPQSFFFLLVLFFNRVFLFHLFFYDARALNIPRIYLHLHIARTHERY